MAALKLKQKDAESAEAAEPKQINIAPPPKKRRGFGKSAKGGCRIVLLLFLLIILVFVAALFAFRTFCTSPTPGDVWNSAVSVPLAEQALQRVKALRTAAKINGIITVYFTEKELNALLQKNVQEIEWKGQVHIALEESLNCDYTLPLTGVPGFRGRHLTGKMVFAFDSGDDGLVVALADGTTLNGYKVPGFVRNMFSGESFKVRALSAPGLQDLADHMGSIKVDNKQLVVTTRKVPETVSK